MHNLSSWKAYQKRASFYNIKASVELAAVWRNVELLMADDVYVLKPMKIDDQNFLRWLLHSLELLTSQV